MNKTVHELIDISFDLKKAGRDLYGLPEFNEAYELILASIERINKLIEEKGGREHGQGISFHGKDGGAD